MRAEGISNTFRQDQPTLLHCLPTRALEAPLMARSLFTPQTCEWLCVVALISLPICTRILCSFFALLSQLCYPWPWKQSRHAEHSVCCGATFAYIPLLRVGEDRVAEKVRRVIGGCENNTRRYVPFAHTHVLT